ncbi:MAG: nucleotidyltransferase domain-containing protein [Polyangiaceae bacterium]|nr:nucleotidyltransferase domain-containing protein [Polyangiaceae bacterium]
MVERSEDGNGALDAARANRSWLDACWPAPHAALLERLVSALERRSEVRACLLGGSLHNGKSDAYSDLDLTLVCRDAERDSLLEGERLAHELGCLSAFRGDHLREPRLLICLFNPPLLHVDLKLVTPSEAGERVEERGLLFCKDPELRPSIESELIELPCVEPAWVMPRVWTWLHYAGTKAARGEVFECLDLLGFLRARVLGPMAQLASGQTGLAAQGLRRFELRAPRYREALAKTVGAPDPERCFAALDAARELYLELHAALAWPTIDPNLAQVVSDFLREARGTEAG